MTPFVSYQSEFAAVLGDHARLVHVVDTDAHEGPAYVADEHALYVTTLPRPHAQIRRIDLDGPRISTVPAAVTMPNGMTLAPDERLLVCEQGSLSAPARISRVDPATGLTEPVVEAWHGLPLNSPNDVVVKSDGTVWFTDPSYGHLQGFRPEPRVGDFVYRYDPTTGHLSVVADSFDKPNGLAFSPDESVLYVADSAGRVYVSSFSGVQVFNDLGDLIGEIRLPGAVNFTFGGPDHNVLFITTDTAVWAAVLQATGTPRTGA